MTRVLRPPTTAAMLGVLLHATLAWALPPCGDPTPGTVAGGTARVVWKDGANDAKDKVSYAGRKADAVSAPQLGDPVDGTSAYRVCIWDTPADATPPRLLYEAEVPAGGRCNDRPCWKALRGKHRRAVRFRDPGRDNPGGVQALDVTVTGSCTVSWSFAATGIRLPDVASLGGRQGQQHDAVIVEIRNGDGLLVQSRFATASARTGTRFQAAVAGPASRCRDRRARGSRPNVLFVLADDLGYGDLGSYGSREIATPNLDRLASEGARFTQFYVGSAVCTPSRATLLTGRYPARMALAGSIGVFFPFSTSGLDPNEQTIAEVLRARGYATAAIGKWHLGHLPAYLPTSQGFDRFFGLPYSNDMNEPWYPGQEPPPHVCDGSESPCRPGVPLMDGETIVEMPAVQETLTERYTERAIAFMRDAVARDQPFFVYYATHLPHVPLYPATRFAGRSAGGLYGDVVEELDASVGDLLHEIQALGVDRDTLVVFTSDNGPWILWTTDDRSAQGGYDAGTASPLRDGKSTTFEGGMRVPMIVRWPRRVPADRVIAEPAAMADWMPTLAGLAGSELPPGVELDGRDIWPLLAGTGPRDPDGDVRYLYYRQDGSGVGAYREGRWKLKLAVRGGESTYSRYDHEDLLFDLEADPGEQHDLAAAMPAQVAELRRRMDELAATVEPPH